MLFYSMIGLLILCALGLIGFIAWVDALQNGLHPPYDVPIDWPVGHELCRTERRSWRSKR